MDTRHETKVKSVRFLHIKELKLSYYHTGFATVKGLTDTEFQTISLQWKSKGAFVWTELNS